MVTTFDKTVTNNVVVFVFSNVITCKQGAIAIFSPWIILVGKEMVLTSVIGICFPQILEQVPLICFSPNPSEYLKILLEPGHRKDGIGRVTVTSQCKSSNHHNVNPQIVAELLLIQHPLWVMCRTHGLQSTESLERDLWCNNES